MEKRILIVDDSKNSTELLQLLLSTFSQYTAEVETDYDEIVKNYENDKYEYIIFDHSCHSSNDLMQYILTNNPAQKCILLSDSIRCPVDCNFCMSTFKFVRLLKPIDAKDILHYIDVNNEFSCPNKHIFDRVDSLEKLHRFLNLESNVYYTEKKLEEDRIVISSTIPTGPRINELEKISDNINEKYFEFNFKADNTIHITKK